ncbi:putative ATP-dependent endonuclease of OLD family [Clostridium algifaecis]|uniref:ATP-dependent endonuclease of OLD family n=1 Tax=Clostridium algifaecis TaxID=1472040 RepID=A0ABS4KT66_9CLOT|nr:AAA family ATPase [Clostridium algifaecis]MBP2033222.1 putative ATP-dependent endonuclease of OLD family [Clostridium algifaecis]
MYLSKISIKGYRLFDEEISIKFNKGINVLVSENGCGKSTIIDAIRMLLNEDDYSRNGVNQEDFYYSIDNSIQSEEINIKGKFSDLSDKKKIEYLTWLDDNYDAILNLSIIKKLDNRNHYKKKIWGGESSNSIFEWEALNDIQCAYLPALRDAKKKLRAGRGSRLARLLLNLSQDEIEEKRKTGKLMEIEEDVNNFNKKLSGKGDIKKADEMINKILQNALGSVFGQKTKIQFNDLTYERIVESLRLVFFSGTQINEETVYRNLSENSLGYNNLIYLATILAEFEGLKNNYTSPRILLIEELEAHLHPQLQMKLLKYLNGQAEKNDIQIIITTHSTTIASSTPIKNLICLNSIENKKITAVSLYDCRLDEKSEKFIDRWMDVTKSTLLFSKGVILVEGLAESILLPKLAEIYLRQYNLSHGEKTVDSLEEAGISVINMNGVFFQYFMQLYRGYQLILPKRKVRETKKDYEERLSKFKKKPKFEEDEYIKVNFIPIRCVAITDNDPDKDKNPTKLNPIDGNNPQLFYIEQLEKMTSNCRVYKNLKTFEYDMAISSKYNSKMMIEILLDNINIDGEVKKTLENYKNKIEECQENDKEVDNLDDIASFILKQIDSLDIGKGMFAQILFDKISKNEEFDVPEYIKKSIDFVLEL